MDWQYHTKIIPWTGQDIIGKKLLVISDYDDIRELFYYLPLIVEQEKKASYISICCRHDCVRLLEKTFDQYANVSVIPLDYHLTELLSDQSYDYLVSLRHINQPYGYNPILSYPKRPIYLERIGNQSINKIICGIALQDDFTNEKIGGLSSYINIYRLLHELDKYCYLYSYDYNDYLEYKDYSIAQIYFYANDIIDLTTSYLSFSDIIIANDNLIASIAVAMGKYVIILADNNNLDRLSTINHPNVCIINLQDNDDIITQIINQFLCFKQKIMQDQSRRQHKIITQALQSDNNAKRAFADYLASEALFKEAVSVLKQIPPAQKTRNDWDHLISGGVLVQNYQDIYDLLSAKSPYQELSNNEKSQLLNCVYNLKNYGSFTEYALQHYHHQFPNIEKLDIDNIIAVLEVAIITSKMEYAIYYYDYLLEYHPIYCDKVEYKFKLIQLYFAKNHFYYGWLILKQTDINNQTYLDGVSLPYWDGKNKDNIRLCILGYDGVGDQIFYLSLIHQFITKCKDIALVNSKRIFSIIQCSFPNAIILNHASPKIKQIDQYYDAKAYLSDMPRLLGIDKPTKVKKAFKIDTKKRNQYHRKLKKLAQNKKIIGVCFYSRSHNSGIQKYCSLDYWQPILAIDNALFVNLQYGARAHDLNIKAKELGIDMVHWNEPDPLTDFDDFMSLIGVMDFTISIASTVAHQAGAIGIPSYVIVDKDYHWFYASPDEYSHWYDSQIIMRQRDNEDDWQGVMERTKNHILEHHF